MGHKGLFYDGQSAQAQPVEVRFEDKALVIAHEGHVLARWRYGTLYLITSGAHAGLRVGSRRAGDARLVLEDAGAIAELRQRAPQLFVKGGVRRLLRQAALFAVASVGVLVAGYYALPYLAEAVVPLVPHKVERRIGAQVHAAFEAAHGTCTSEADKKALAILDRLAERLLTTTGAPYTVSIVVSRMKLENAFALPGGIVVVTRELIVMIESPDELAGVLSHELGHVVERHAMIGMVESVGLSLASTLLLGGGSGSGEWLVNVASTLASLSYSRRLEARADERGIAMLEAAGISPKGLAVLFERLERRDAQKQGSEGKDEGGKGSAEAEDSLSVFLSSHPPSALRIARAQKASLSQAAPALTAEEWAVVKAVCRTETTAPSEARPAAPPPEARP